MERAEHTHNRLDKPFESTRERRKKEKIARKGNLKLKEGSSPPSSFFFDDYDTVESDNENEINGTNSHNLDLDNSEPSSLPFADQIKAEVETGNVEYKWKLVNKTGARFDQLVTQLKWRLGEGSGCAVYMLGFHDDGTPRGLNQNDFNLSINTLTNMANRLNCTCTIEQITQTKNENLKCATISIKEKSNEMILNGIYKESELKNLRIAVIGEYDSGKSTLIGVLVDRNGKWDDGSGSARTNVFLHRHELTSGKTSSISRQIIAFDQHGNINSNKELRTGIWTANDSNNNSSNQSNKFIMFLDLAGHHSHLKTTIRGLIGQQPDYALCTIDSTQPKIASITKEHLIICIALDIPIIIVFTKIDKVDHNQIQLCQSQIKNLLTSTPIKREPINIDDNFFQSELDPSVITQSTVPILSLSSVTGEGFNNFKKFLHFLPKLKSYSQFINDPLELAVHDCIFLENNLTVLSGLVLRGSISTGSKVLLGPDLAGRFSTIVIKSIHVKKRSCKTAVAGQTVTLATVKKLQKEEVRRGMFILAIQSQYSYTHSPITNSGKLSTAINNGITTSPISRNLSVDREGPLDGLSLGPRSCIGFTARITVLEHEGISLGYSPVIHIGAITQVAVLTFFTKETTPDNTNHPSNTNDFPTEKPVSTVLSGEEKMNDVLRRGDKAIARFNFLYHPEFVRLGEKFIFREGRTKGVGKIINIHFLDEALVMYKNFTSNSHTNTLSSSVGQSSEDPAQSFHNHNLSSSVCSTSRNDSNKIISPDDFSLNQVPPAATFAAFMLSNQKNGFTPTKAAYSYHRRQSQLRKLNRREPNRKKRISNINLQSNNHNELEDIETPSARSTGATPIFRGSSLSLTEQGKKKTNRKPKSTILNGAGKESIVDPATDNDNEPDLYDFKLLHKWDSDPNHDDEAITLLNNNHNHQPHNEFPGFSSSIDSPSVSTWMSKDLELNRSLSLSCPPSALLQSSSVHLNPMSPLIVAHPASSNPNSNPSPCANPFPSFSEHAFLPSALYHSLGPHHQESFEPQSRSLSFHSLRTSNQPNSNQSILNPKFLNDSNDSDQNVTDNLPVQNLSLYTIVSHDET